MRFAIALRVFLACGLLHLACVGHAQPLMFGEVDQVPLPAVQACVVSPSSPTQLAVVVKDGDELILKVVDGESLEVVHSMPLNLRRAPSLGFSPDGKVLGIQSDRSSTLIVIDVKTGRKISQADVQRVGHSAEFLTMIAENKALITLREGSYPSAAVISSKSGRLDKKLSLHPARERSIFVSGHGKRMIVVTADDEGSAVELWDTQHLSRQISVALPESENVRSVEVYGIAESSDGNEVYVLARAANKTSLFVVDVKERALTKTITPGRLSPSSWFHGDPLMVLQDKRFLLLQGQHLIDLQNDVGGVDLEDVGIGMQNSNVTAAAKLSDTKFLIVPRPTHDQPDPAWSVMSTDIEAVVAAAPRMTEDGYAIWPIPLPAVGGTPAQDAPSYKPVAGPDTSKWLPHSLLLADDRERYAGIAIAPSAQPPTLFAGIGEGFRRVREEDILQPTVIKHLDLTTSQPIATSLLPPQRVILAASPDATRLLVGLRQGRFSNSLGDNKFNRLEIYSLPQPDGNPDIAKDAELSIAWTLEQNGDFFREARDGGNWAAWALPNVVVVRIARRVIAFNIDQQRGLWVLDKVSAAPAVSPDGKSIALVSGGQPLLIDTLTGKTLASLGDIDPSNPNLARSVGGSRTYRYHEPAWASFSPEGTHLVMSRHDGIHVYDLAEGTSRHLKVPANYGLGVPGVATEVLALPDSKALFNTALVDLSESKLVYGYTPNANWIGAGSDGRVLFLGLVDDQIGLATARLPMARHVQQLVMLANDPPPITPQTTFTPKITSAPTGAGDAMQKLQESFKEIGRLGDDAIIELGVVEEATGETIEYREGFLGQGQVAHTERATNMTGSCRILIGDRVIYENKTHIYSTPQNITLTKEGETGSSYVNDRRVGAVQGFLQSRKLPAYITFDGEWIQSLEHKLGPEDHEAGK